MDKSGITFGSISELVDAPLMKSQTKCSAIEEDPPLPQVNIFFWETIDSANTSNTLPRLS